MGAHDWLLVFSDGDAAKILRAGPSLDRGTAAAVAARLHPNRVITPIADGMLGDHLSPEDGEIYVAAYPGLTIVCTSEAAEDYPSALSATLRNAVPARDVYLHAMHSAVDWFAYAIWSGGTLRRALSLSPDSGVIENVGPPLPFERPYWAGERPIDLDPGEDDEPYPFPFHSLDLGENALRELLGFGLESGPEPGDADPWALPVAGFAVS
jgi:hypothetical protein